MKRVIKKELTAIAILVACIVAIFAITIAYEIRLNNEMDMFVKKYTEKIEAEMAAKEPESSGEFANQVATFESFDDGTVKIVTLQPYMKQVNEYTMLITKQSDEEVIEALEKGE